MRSPQLVEISLKTGCLQIDRNRNDSFLRVFLRLFEFVMIGFSDKARSWTALFMAYEVSCNNRWQHVHKAKGRTAGYSYMLPGHNKQICLLFQRIGGILNGESNPRVDRRLTD